MIATGSDAVCNCLAEKGYDIVDDIPYQEGVLELIKRKTASILILSADLSGEYDKYIFIEKIREIDMNLKIIVIVDEAEDNYRKFLYSKGIFHIFTDGKSLIEDLETAIKEIENEISDSVLRQKKVRLNKSHDIKSDSDFKANTMRKYHRQEIITFAGVGSTGKTTVSSYFSKILAEKTGAKVLLIDFDIINANINHFMKVGREPDKPGYILPVDKNASLNYMIDAIDKKNFSAGVFQRCVIKSKHHFNLDILTGNRSLYVCKNVLSVDYYLKILETAKTLYDYIVIDTSGNIFLDSMQFSLLNGTEIFVIAEGNYISLERNYRLIKEFFSIWGVPESKVKLLINKYSFNSLDKLVIKEVLKEYEIAGYIKFSDKYEELINTPGFTIPIEIKEQYDVILETMGIIENSSGVKAGNLLKKRLLNLKNS